MRCYLTKKPEHTMDIRNSDLALISEALCTQIRLLEARINKTQDDQLRILRFQRLKDDIDCLLIKD